MKRYLLTLTRHAQAQLRLPKVVLAALGVAAGITLAQPIQATAATLPPATCSLAGITRTCDLYARIGTLALPNVAPQPIWGYALTNVASATVPGPALIANEGETLIIRLHNVDVPGATSLMVTGQLLVPDTVGVTPGATTNYTITAIKPGTFLYEAGLTPNGPRQVAMGLFGGLVVRPTACASCAYDAASAFNDEALLVLSEIDPAFNANPITFDMSAFAPKYWLINGAVFPNTEVISTTASRKVLLRYVNAGLQHHSMSTAGVRQLVVGTNGQRDANPLSLIAQTIPAAGTQDSLVTIPASASAGAKFPIFDAAMRLDNNGARSNNTAASPVAFGGMLTFLSVPVSVTITDTVGPVASAVTIAPNPSNGTVNAVLSASISDVATGNSNVTAAEYFADAIGANGAGCAMSGAFGSPTVSVNATIPVVGGVAPCVNLTALSSGNHTFYVHGRDSAGNWGAVASVVFNLDKGGPSIINASLSPSVTNGTGAVNLQATATDVASGNQNIAAAEYRIDSGAAVPIAIGGAPAPIANLAASIPLTAVSPLTQGIHLISVRARDAQNNWGINAVLTLTIDKTGPNTAGVVAMPNPTNGTFGVQGGTGGFFYERVDATVTDPVSGTVNSNIATAEYFLDITGTNGTGQAMLATGGVFNGVLVPVYQLINLNAISVLPQGQHTLFVHGRDAAGNWGFFGSGPMIVDKTVPTITAAAFTVSASGMTLTVTASDPANTGTPANGPASNIVAAEWFTGTDPGVGLANAIAVPTPATPVTVLKAFSLAALPAGTNVFVRVKDAANNWSATVSRTAPSNNLFANGFDASSSTNFTAWSSVNGSGTRLTQTTGATQAGTRKLSALVQSSSSGYVQDNTPAAETQYHARFYFNPNGMGTGSGASPTVIQLFNGLNGANASIMQIDYRGSTSAPYQVRLTVATTGGPISTGWFSLTNNAWNAIELAWQSGGSTSASLYVGGVLRQTLTGLNTSASTLETVRLGPQGALPGNTFMNGYFFYDSFVSTRFTVIGP